VCKTAALWKRAADLFVYWESGAVFCNGWMCLPWTFSSVWILHKYWAKQATCSFAFLDSTILWQTRCVFDMPSQHCTLCSPASEFNEAIAAKSWHLCCEERHSW